MKLIQKCFLIALVTPLVVSFLGCCKSGCQTPIQHEADIVIYGGTSSGIAAAIQASRMGKSVILLEPSNRLGGLSTGGLGQTDIGNKQAIGGISREFYRGIRDYYQNPENWVWQQASQYRSGGQSKTEDTEDTMWTFEPTAAVKVFEKMMAAENIEVHLHAKLDRESGVEISDGRIVQITMLDGVGYVGKIFMDTTYEGDLFAAAGVSYSVGREANSQFGETLSGVQANRVSKNLMGGESVNGKNHNFVKGVDPYIVKGDPSSGLLPFINPEPIEADGTGDRKVQAYCFRMCLTDHPENRIPFVKPEHYDPLDYELLLRNFEAGEKRIPWINSRMPNRKTDTNNCHGFSMDFIGQNWDYPEASYEKREQIIELHLAYQKGLMWTLANHPRVPESVRKEVSRWGTCKDEFDREDGWQQQLYIREARRMVGEHVMTQHHCEGLEVVKDSVGLGAYGMDSHHIQRYVTEDGYVLNEGNVQSHVAAPYAISYRSIVPKREECENLYVPVCLSATHIAFGSIRMEPVFMVLGQSAATAASLAIDSGLDVQDVDYSLLKTRLLEDQQRL